MESAAMPQAIFIALTQPVAEFWPVIRVTFVCMFMLSHFVPYFDSWGSSINIQEVLALITIKPVYVIKVRLSLLQRIQLSRHIELSTGEEIFK